MSTRRAQRERRLPPPGALLALVLGASAALHAALGPRYGGEIVVGMLEAPSALAPAAPRSPEHRLVLGLVHDRLIDLSPRGEPLPRLATSWSASADAREWTLTLVDRAVCQDDEPADAEAVARSLRRLLRSPTAAGASLAHSLEGGPAYRAGTTEDLPGMRTAPPRQIVLHLGPGGEGRLAPLASWAAAITSRGGAPCGPFAAAGTVGDTATAFTANAGHWAGRPLADRVRLVAYASREELGRAVRDGDAHLGLGIGDTHGLGLRLVLWLETRRGPFASSRARELVATLDRTALATRYLQGSQPLFSLLSTGDAPDGPAGPRPFPATRLSGGAKLLVAQDVPALASQRVVAHLLALGLAVEVQTVPRDALRKGSADARLMLWAPDVPDAELALRELAALVDAPDAAALCDAADAAASGGVRARSLAQAETALMGRHALIPLALAPLALAARPEIHDVRVDAAGGLILEDAWLAP